MLYDTMQVAVVHFCDHETYVRYFARKYACMSMRFPYEPFSDETFWEELKEEKGIDVFEVMENPTYLLKQYDIMRTR